MPGRMTPTMARNSTVLSQNNAHSRNEADVEGLTDSRAHYASVFEPLTWQVKPLKDYSPTMLLTGSAGGGKSRLAAEKLHMFCLRYPGSTALVVRKTRESVKNSLVLLLKKIVIGDDVRVRHNAGDRRFEYANGSILIYAGMKDEEQREQIRSVGIEGGVDIAWMEEATQFAEDDYNELSARMRGNRGGFRQIILTTNPDSPYHWIYRRMMEGGEATVYKSRADQNRYNPASYHRVLKTLTGIQKIRLVDGKWEISAEGAIYDMFDPTIHVKNELPQYVREYPRRVIAGVDWGFSNPGVIQVWLLDNDDRMWLAEEVYKTRELIGWWTEEAKRLDARWHIETFACDPSEPAYIEQFQNAGLNAVKADNSILPGIDAVKNRMTVIPESEGGDGKPRFYLTRSGLSEPDELLEERKKPTNIMMEIPGYRRPKPKDGGELENEKPDKKLGGDHALDAARYAVQLVDEGEGVFLA